MADVTVSANVDSFLQSADKAGMLTVLNVADGAEVNTINSAVAGEPTGSDLVTNVVSLTQAEYDAGTPVSTTLYVITDA